MPKRLDKFLVIAAAALLVAIFFDAARRWSPGSGSSGEVPAATVPQLVRLVPSSTAFLANCPVQDIHLVIGAGKSLTLRFAGGRCHVPPLHLREIVRNAKGAVVYRGPALASEALSGNYAISGSAQGELLGPCGAVVVSGSGLRASGAVPCP